MAVARPHFEHDVIISGIGQSDVGRHLARSPLALTLDAVGVAVADAGLEPTDIGGLATYPGGGTALGAGFSGPSLISVYEALGIEPDVLMGGFEGPAQLGPILSGCLAISSGVARHVVVYRTVTEGSARRAVRQAAGGGGGAGDGAGAGAGGGGGAGAGVPPTGAWFTALGGGPPPIGPALMARRHFHRFGTTREQLAQVALTARRHAALNPKAVFRDALTLDEYMGARMISDPLCLYDCDVHCDGATALVLSHADFAGDGAAPPVRIDAMGVAPSERAEYPHQVGALPGRRAADQMWARTDLRPADVDVAGLYDGFSILTLLWLEALGFCGPGEAGSFVEDGTRISLGGPLPINTNGGQLSGGRLHGFGFVHEMCLQLRGQAGGRQVQAASVAAVAVGAVPYVGCMILRSDG